jgi:hypothetical protein
VSGHVYGWAWGKRLKGQAFAIDHITNCFCDSITFYNVTNPGAFFVQFLDYGTNFPAVK